jgi:hypothetical protein
MHSFRLGFVKFPHGNHLISMWKLFKVNSTGKPFSVRYHQSKIPKPSFPSHSSVVTIAGRKMLYRHGGLNADSLDPKPRLAHWQRMLSRVLLGGIG